MTTSQTIGGMPSKCGACGGTSLVWFASNENRSGVQEGRLRTNEVSCVFVLGCDDCSETLRVVGADKMASLLNKPAAQPQGEPVAYRWRVKPDGKWSASVCKVEYDARANDDRFEAMPLYAEQPAPVAEGITWKAQGDANFYVLLKNGNWFAAIQLNGEMLVSQHESFLNGICPQHEADANGKARDV